MRRRTTINNLARGFTLVEAAISVAIVGVMLTASLKTFGTIAQNRRIQIERRQGYMLANQLMTEILQTYFQDPGSNPVFGPETGETRATYEDVDDYNGLSETPPTERDGMTMTNYAGWTRSVAVAYVTPASPTTVSASATTLKRITVTVTAPNRKSYVVVGVRAQKGVYEQVPVQQTNYVTGVTLKIQIGTAGPTIYTASHPLNISTSQQ